MTYAVIYKWKIDPAREPDFRDAWRNLTRAFRAEAGGLGSSLHRTEDDWWLAYARWPDRDIYDAAPSGEILSPADFEVMQEAILESAPPVKMELVDDLLLSGAESPA